LIISRFEIINYLPAALEFEPF